MTAQTPQPQYSWWDPRGWTFAGTIDLAWAAMKTLPLAAMAGWLFGTIADAFSDQFPNNKILKSVANGLHKGSRFSWNMTTDAAGRFGADAVQAAGKVDAAVEGDGPVGQLAGGLVNYVSGTPLTAQQAGAYNNLVHPPAPPAAANDDPPAPVIVPPTPVPGAPANPPRTGLRSQQALAPVVPPVTPRPGNDTAAGPQPGAPATIPGPRVASALSPTGTGS